MKRQLIINIMIILLTIFCVGNSVQASSEKALNAEWASNKEKVKQGETIEFILTLDCEENINSFMATIDYDDSVWETLTESDFEVKENWESLQYNSANKTFAIINKETVTGKNEVVSVTFKAKTDSNSDKASISLKDMKASDGTVILTNSSVKKDVIIEVISKNENTTVNNTTNTNTTVAGTTNTNTNSTNNNAEAEKNNSTSILDKLLYTGANYHIIFTLIIAFVAILVIFFVKMKKKKIAIMILVVILIFGNVYPIFAVSSETAVFVGDISNNSVLDDDDIEMLEKHLISLETVKNKTKADMNSDSNINILDLSLLIKQEQECPYDKNNVTGITSWKSVPIVSSELLGKDEVTTGGEGCQWPIGTAISKDGNLLLFGTNVGGIYRSEDGGKNFAQANSGLGARGAGAFAIDPKNSSYVIAIGINSGAYDTNGIYLSEDSGNTWSFKKSMLIIGNKEVRDSVAYDESSYDATQNRCMIAYWSAAYELESNGLNDSNKGLYKSEDGGYTWNLINSDLSDGTIKINPSTGELYISKADGIYYSNDKGASFTKIVNDSITGFDGVITDNGFCLYYCNTKGLYKSENCQDFEIITSTTFPTKGPYHVRVNPLDANKIIVMNYAGSYQNQPYYTEDGGTTWKKSTLDNSLSIMPYNNRGGIPLWSPVDTNKVWVFIQGDFISSSTDGGKTFKWDSNGITGILAGGQIHYNVYNSDIIYFGSQDYNGCISTDGGETWKYVNMSGYNWGGYCYGGYAVDENTYFVGVADSWKGKRKLKITFDGGATVIDTGLYFTEENLGKGQESSYQSPTNPNVLFACDLRSEDGGHTWEKMSGCINVYTHNPKGQKELYGLDETGKNVVVSYDDGKTWKKVNNEEFKEGNSTLSVTDVACDWKNNSVYVACGSSYLYRVSLETGESEYVINKNIAKYNVAPLNMKGKNIISKVEVDPNDPNIIYCGGSANTYINDCSLYRSVDGGKSFQVVTTNTTNSIVKNGTQSGFETVGIEVNPKTGEVLFAGNCFGFSKLSAPYPVSYLKK